MIKTETHTAVCGMNLYVGLVKGNNSLLDVVWLSARTMAVKIADINMP